MRNRSCLSFYWPSPSSTRSRNFRTHLRTYQTSRNHLARLTLTGGNSTCYRCGRSPANAFTLRWRLYQSGVLSGWLHTSHYSRRLSRHGRDGSSRSSLGGPPHRHCARSRSLFASVSRLWSSSLTSAPSHYECHCFGASRRTHSLNLWQPAL